MAAANDTKFYFRATDKGSVTLANKETQELLLKWSLNETLQAYKFSFDQQFQAFEIDNFLKDLFNSEEVANKVKVLSTVNGSWATISQIGKFEAIEKEEIPCTLTTMEFFDRLYDCGVLRKSGSINGCVPDIVDNVPINNELSKVLLVEDSDNFEEFSPEERKEFLFRLFTHLVVGGPLNQYEDFIGPYFDTTKNLYKDLVSVSKDAVSNKPVVTSLVYKVNLKGALLFAGTDGEQNSQNFLYVLVSPTKKSVTLLYNAWVGD